MAVKPVITGINLAVCIEYLRIFSSAVFSKTYMALCKALDRNAQDWCNSHCIQPYWCFCEARQMLIWLFLSVLPWHTDCSMRLGIL